ncbi:MAG TPA: P-loop NTPase [Acidimicrobiia bacterium]|nr:P-loop NTPase [Acidimicrobiia bacterium]
MRPILLVGSTDAVARKVQGALAEGVRERLRLWTQPVTDSGGIDAVLWTRPAVVVLGPGLVDKVLLRLAQAIDVADTDVEVVLIHNGGVEPDAALAAGVRGLITKSADDDAIRAAIGRALVAAERRLSREVADSTPEPTPRRCRVTTVVSPKGGAGKTVLSTNLAVGLAAVAPRGVVLVDLDLQFGDVAYALGLKPRHTIYDAVATAGIPDITTLKVFLTHHSSDLYVLCAPDEPHKGEMVEVEMVQQIISLLAAEFDHVVVDTPAGLSEHALATLDLSSDVIFLADMDVPSIRHLNKVVRALDQLGMKKARRHFLLNRADARVGMSMMQVATQAGLAVDLEIPVSKQVPVTLNEGKPIILTNPKSPVSRKVVELVERLTGTTQPAIAAQPLKRSA